MLTLASAAQAGEEAEPQFSKYSCFARNMFHADQQINFDLTLSPQAGLIDTGPNTQIFYKNDLVSSPVRKAYSNVIVDRTTSPESVKPILAGRKWDKGHNKVFYTTVQIPNSKYFVAFSQSLDHFRYFEVSIQKSWKGGGLIAQTKALASMEQISLVAYDKAVSVHCFLQKEKPSN